MVLFIDFSLYILYTESNLKDKISAILFAKIKSNLANIEANMQIENNIYKLNSNIDLKEYAKSKINLDATGDLEKVSFSIKSDDLKVIWFGHSSFLLGRPPISSRYGGYTAISKAGPIMT